MCSVSNPYRAKSEAYLVRIVSHLGCSTRRIGAARPSKCIHQNQQAVRTPAQASTRQLFFGGFTNHSGPDVWVHAIRCPNQAEPQVSAYGAAVRAIQVIHRLSAPFGSRFVCSPFGMGGGGGGGGMPFSGALKMGAWNALGNCRPGRRGVRRVCYCSDFIELVDYTIHDQPLFLRHLQQATCSNILPS